MKRLICAAVVAGSLFAMADEAKKEAAAPAAPAPAKVEAAKEAPKPPRASRITPEQRAEMKAKREKYMAERRAAMNAKLLPVVMKYVSDEAKAKELLEELDKAKMQINREMRRPPMPPRKPADKRPADQKPAEQK